jgi:hypothetical protein
MRELLQATLRTDHSAGKFYSCLSKGCIPTNIWSTGKVIVLSIDELNLKVVAVITSSSHYGLL